MERFLFGLDFPEAEDERRASALLADADTEVSEPVMWSEEERWRGMELGLV
jgi:hypothetical protein